MHALLLLIAVLIGYGSLYPFGLAANDDWLRQAAALFTRPELRMGRGDLVGNLLLFVPYGFVATLASTAHKAPRPAAGRLSLLLLLGLALALTLQLAQLWLPSRVPALNDVILNGAGMLLGVTAAQLARRFLPITAGQAGTDSAAALPHALAPGVLMLLWLGYQWFPLVPTLDLQNLINALKPLLHAPQVDGLRTLHTALAWLAFLQLWELAAARRVATLTLAAAALAMASAKLFIVGATLSPANLIGLGLALVCLPWRHRPTTLPALTIAMFISLLASGLAPFDPLSQPKAFLWMPFSGMLQGSMSVNLLNLLEKCFFYGALIMLISAKGGRPWAAAIVVASCLAMIEAAQAWLPNRTAESTDPVLALILGFVIRLGSPSARQLRQPPAIQAARGTP